MKRRGGGAKGLLALLAIIAMSAVLYFIFSSGLGKTATPQDAAVAQQGSSPIIINEVVASNKLSLIFNDTAPDWVELYNTSGNRINLNGYGLSNSAKSPYKFTFPNISIEPNGYLVVFCTGEENRDANQGYLSAKFKLSSKGDTLILSAPKDVTIQVIQIPEMPTDISFGILDGTYGFFALPTPNAKNTGEFNPTSPKFADVAVDGDIRINEVMINNKYSIMDSDGDRPDWVELINTGTEPASLKGVCLTDDEKNPGKWAFPDKTLAPGEILLVLCSGKDKVTETEIHTSFKISSVDGMIALITNSGQLMDRVNIDEMSGNISKGRDVLDHSTWLYYAEPTPGKPNSTKGFADITQSTEKYLPDLRITEVKASGGETPDFVEIGNFGAKSIDISGYGLSDKKSGLVPFKFGEKTLAPGEFISVDTDGQTLNLSASGQTIYLTDTSGSILDHFDTGFQSSGITSGRTSESSYRVYYTSGSKGIENPKVFYLGYAPKPVFSKKGGFMVEAASVEISAIADTIYYTLDGSKPTDKSTKYSGAISVAKNAVIRAIAYAKDYLPSEVVSETYYFERHEIPVVCIASEPAGLFSEATGIFAEGLGVTPALKAEDEFWFTKANYWKKDWEREIAFQFFEADGKRGVSFPAGIKIFGQYSRRDPQKSIAVYLRAEYGHSWVTYPFFRDTKVTKFKSLILRTSGQDWNNTKIKDAFVGQSIKGIANVDFQEYRPAVLYINGEYYGLYNIREKISENYFVTHYPGLAVKGKIDSIKGNANVRAGSNDDWGKQYKTAAETNNVKNGLRGYIKTALAAGRCNVREFQDYVEERVDMQSLYDWTAIEAIIANTDTGNIRAWRYEGGKWRWFLFDSDWAWQTNGYANRNYLAAIMSGGHGTGDNFWTHFQEAISKNDKWRREFMERYAFHLNFTFKKERLVTLIEAMATEIRPEMAMQVGRWGKPDSVDKWEQNVNNLKITVDKRVEQAKFEFKKYFGLSDSEYTALVKSVAPKQA